MADWRRTFCCMGGMRLPTEAACCTETLIRLPGYPLFLAACFKLFGVDNYNAVAYVQIALELLGCLLLAGFARRIARPEIKHGAALATLWLAALCPFTASYAAAPLTETPTLFAIALALWAVGRFNERPGWGSALWFTFAITFAAMLRPDGALVGVALAPALVVGLKRGAVPEQKLVRMVLVCVLLAMIPFAAWTARNWRVFHVVQPLAPRYAKDPDEVGDPGWQRWVKTWCLDFISTYEIYWNVPGGPSRIEQAAGAGVRLAGAVCRNCRAGCRVQRTMGRNLRRGWMRGLRGWPRSGSGRIRCAIISGCRWAGWPICGCGRGWKICPSIWTGGSMHITTQRRGSVGRTRG